MTPREGYSCIIDRTNTPSKNNKGNFAHQHIDVERAARAFWMDDSGAATLTRTGASPMKVLPGGSIRVGRKDFADTGNSRVQHSSISRQQLIFSLSQDGMNFTVLRIGNGASRVKRAAASDNAAPTEEMVKDQPTRLLEGDVVYMHSNSNATVVDYPITVSLAEAPYSAVGSSGSAAGDSVSEESAFGLKRKRADAEAARPSGSIAGDMLASSEESATDGKRKRADTEVAGEFPRPPGPTVRSQQDQLHSLEPSAALPTRALPSSETAPPAAEPGMKSNAEPKIKAEAPPDVPVEPPSSSSGVPKADGPLLYARMPHLPAPKAREPSGWLFRAMTVPWKPFGEAMRSVAVTLSLSPDPADHLPGSCLLSARACDGLELLGTAAPVPCPWTCLPAGDALLPTLRSHPLYFERMQLALQRRGPHLGPTDVQTGDEPPFVMDLIRLRSRAEALAATEAAKAAATQMQPADGARAVPAATDGPRGYHASSSSSFSSTGGSLGLGGDMLGTLLGQIRMLQARAAAQAAANDALRVRLREREEELSAGVEHLRSVETRELSSLLPLLLAKHAKLAELEAEAVANHVRLPDEVEARLRNEVEQEEGDAGPRRAERTNATDPPRGQRQTAAGSSSGPSSSACDDGVRVKR